MKARSKKNLQKLVSLVLGMVFLFGVIKIDVWAADLSALLSMNAGAAEVIDAIDTMTMDEVTELATLDDEEEAEEKEEYNIVMARVNESMNIRELPDSGSEKVGLLYADCGGTILEEGDGWTKIQSGNLVGWAKNDYLVFGEAAYNLAQEIGIYEATVNASGLRMRKEPTAIHSSVVCSLIAWKTSPFSTVVHIPASVFGSFLILKPEAVTVASYTPTSLEKLYAASPNTR